MQYLILVDPMKRDNLRLDRVLARLKFIILYKSISVCTIGTFLRFGYYSMPSKSNFNSKIQMSLANTTQWTTEKISTDIAPYI